MACATSNSDTSVSSNSAPRDDAGIVHDLGWSVRDITVVTGPV